MKKFVLFLSIFISILYSFFWYKSTLCNEEMALEYLSKARILQDKEDYTGTMLFLNNGIKCCPHIIHLYDDRSRLFLFFGEYKKAISDLSTAIQLNEEAKNEVRFLETKIKLYFRRGYLYKKIKQYEKALNDYNWTAKQDSTEYGVYEKSISYSIHKDKGDIYLQLGLLNESLSEYEKSLDHTPLKESDEESVVYFIDRIVVLSQMGLVNFLLEKKEENVANFQKVICHHQSRDKKELTNMKKYASEVLFAYAQAYDYLSKSLKDDDKKKQYQKYILELSPNYNFEKY